MAGGGELRAFFKGAQEDTAQAVESVAHKMASFGEQTARNVRDSIDAVQNADGASADAINGIHGKLGADGAGGLPGAAASGGGSNLASGLLHGDGPAGSGSLGTTAEQQAIENDQGSPEATRRWL